MEGVEGTLGTKILLSNSCEDTADTLLSWKKNNNKPLFPTLPFVQPTMP